MEGGIRGLLGVAIVLAVGGGGGMIASTALASRAYQSRGEQAKKSAQSLNVTGSARKRIRSDLAIWRIQVAGEGKDLKSAFQVLKDGFDRVTKFLHASKFKPEEIATGAIDTRTHYGRDAKGNETSDIVGYRLSRTFTVTTSRVDEIAGPAATVTELIEQGVNVSSEAPDYVYTKLGDLKVEMLGEATKDARARAEQIAANAGCALSEVHSARMGVMQITRPNSTEVSDSGVCDTSSIDKDVTAVVSLAFGLESR